jgi:hypothetical protein
MPELSTLVGMNRLGCVTALPAPPGAGYVPVSTAAGIVWQVAGAGGEQPGATTVEVAVTGGALIVTVNGVAAQVPGVPVADAFGVPLGYLLPT